ncbi:tyrosine-type recombinase/integrase [Schinkia azotoformans]|uniref:tyrosine-type recombinase/integrase n=1 Tax=Schinkia azotoformans TaxID=1454 RepID=UPI002DB9B521|nr:tyrosine-type recombinase/integrase [Schinkia azotoformans]MEC1722097.1 tyrosine-type recombinase/integrase [Schinkia azotoformans]MED4415198.1 tyrosine-type recombinase/integrase [Schinkia azotoformans]
MKIKDKRLFELLKEYLTVYLPSQKTVSPNTVKSYRETLNLYIEFLCSSNNLQLKDISFKNISVGSINAFLKWLEDERHCGLTTLNHRLSVIRAFLKYVGMKVPTYNDYYLSASQVAKRKPERKLTVDHFSEEALNVILSQPDPQTRKGHRDLFYMILLYDTGARDCEILNLMPKDVVTETGSPYIIVHGKGKQIRMIPIMKETVQHYKSYMKRFHQDKENNVPVFYTEIHGAKHTMSDDNVARFIKKYASLARSTCADVPERVTPHMYRHSRALNLYRKGVPLPLISEWLGHSNLETTLIYAYADTEMKRAAIEEVTNTNHPIRKTKGFESVALDNDTLKRLYGLR